MGDPWCIPRSLVQLGFSVICWVSDFREWPADRPQTRRRQQAENTQVITQAVGMMAGRIWSCWGVVGRGGGWSQGLRVRLASCLVVFAPDLSMCNCVKCHKASLVLS